MIPKDGPVKSRKFRNLSFRRKPESSYFKTFWTPAFAGVTALRTFYEFIKKKKAKKISRRRALGGFSFGALRLGQ